MPELPEVETVRNGLLPVMRGHVFKTVMVARHDLRGGVQKNLAQDLTGACVVDIVRRGKYMIMLLDHALPVLWHLGMSGRVRIYDCVKDYIPEAHDHILMDMDSGRRIVFCDPRRFGMFRFMDGQNWEQEKPFNRMGPEPLSNAFSGPVLWEALQKRGCDMKAALLNQAIVSGLGNIYVCEALFETHIHPRRMAKDITQAEAEKLVVAIREVLMAAIAAGGSTLRDYKKADGDMGYFQHQFKVYGQEGEACVHGGCDGIIDRIVQSGRSTFYCPKCQL